jgi:hypothetical protein
VQEREITLGDLGRLQEWVKSEPFAPDGDWYKDFGSFKLCGSNEYRKTGLTKSMAALGKRIQERGNQ